MPKGHKTDLVWFPGCPLCQVSYQCIIPLSNSLCNVIYTILLRALYAGTTTYLSWRREDRCFATFWSLEIGASDHWPITWVFLTIICINDLISLTHSGIWLLPNSLTCFIHCLAKLSLSVTYGRLVAFYRYSPVSSINKTDRTHVRYNPNVVENTNKNIRKVWTYCTYSSPGQSGNPRSRHHNTKLKYVATF